MEYFEEGVDEDTAWVLNMDIDSELDMSEMDLSDDSIPTLTKEESKLVSDDINHNYHLLLNGLELEVTNVNDIEQYIAKAIFDSMATSYVLKRSDIVILNNTSNLYDRLGVDKTKTIVIDKTDTYFGVTLGVYAVTEKDIMYTYDEYVKRLK